MGELKNKNELHSLIIREIEGDLSGDDFFRLQEYLKSNDLYCDAYAEAVIMCSLLHKNSYLFDSSEIEDSGENSKDRQFCFAEEESIGCQFGTDSNVSLRGVGIEEFFDANRAEAEGSEMTCDMLELLEMERTAPAVVIPEAVPPRELIQKVVRPPREKRKLSKFQKFQLAFAACFMFFLIYISYSQQTVPLPIVAELADSINAVWDADMQMPDGHGEMLQSTYRLKRGYASILFKGGAKITVEGPVVFSLLGGGNMELFEGNIYAVVPENAVGFTVMAGSSKIVDLGTEFGVEVDNKGDCQLHVTRGKIMLFAGLQSSEKLKVDVEAGEAKKIYSDGFVKDIDVDKGKFVRRINSSTGVIFNGQYEFVDKRPLAGRHDDFFLSDDPDSPRGVTVSIYDGSYDARTDYDSLIPAATATYMLGALQEPGFPRLGKSGEIIRKGYYFEKKQAFVARGYIELPESGKYVFVSGWESYSYNVMELNGRQVYRKNIGDQRPVQHVVDIVAGKRYPVKITYFNGGGSGFWAFRVE